MIYKICCHHTEKGLIVLPYRFVNRQAIEDLAKTLYDLTGIVHSVEIDEE
jgi:hypothetical protein